MTENEKAGKILEACLIPSCHSNFQIKNFIIGKESSNIGKIWQCIREIQSRHESLANLAVDFEEVNDNIQLAKLDILEEKAAKVSHEDKEIENILLAKKELQVRKKERALQKLEKTKKLLENQRSNVQHELKVFLETFDELGGIEAFKEYNEETAQAEYWKGKFEKEFMLSSMLGQPLSIEFVKSCLAFYEKFQFSENIGAHFDIINKKLIEKK
jgi:hypothetical protein